MEIIIGRDDHISIRDLETTYCENYREVLRGYDSSFCCDEGGTGSARGGGLDLPDVQRTSFLPALFRI
jgi:hypothetical protein